MRSIQKKKIFLIENGEGVESMVNIRKIKQAVSIVLTSTLFITTILPISNVYADESLWTVQINGNANGSSESFGSPYNTSGNIGKLGADSVRAYIYDIKADEFIQGEYEGNRFDAIDFLGSQSAGLYNQIASDCYDQDVSKETAFKTAENIFTENSYPFEKAYVDVGNNTYISNTYEITEGLKENNGAKLKDIVETYWGSNVYNTLRRNGNLIFVVEPLMITSSLDDEGYLSQTAYYHDRTVTTTYPHTRKSYYGIPESLENVEPFDKCENESYEDENGVYHSYYGLDTDNESDYNELVYAICESKNCPKSEAVRLVKEQYDYFGITHFDVWVEEWTSTEEETISEPVYQHYRYKLGTARYFMEYYDMEVKEYESGEYSTSQLGVPSYYNVPHWLGRAVFTEHIGENGRYDSHYNLAFPTEVTTDSEKLTAYWNGDSTALEMDGKITTFGMAVLAPGCDAGIWHTNKYTTGEPSGVPADDVTNYPNDNGHPYGNNV